MEAATTTSASGLTDEQNDFVAAIRDFAELEAARAWRQTLAERGLDSVLTADWPLDEFGGGDIALRVPRQRANEAEELLEPEDPS